MQTRTILHALVLLGSTPAWSQNLVPNPSFEDNTGCPGGWDELHLAAPWARATDGSPDYYHACSTDALTDVPDNFFGSAEPSQGDGYAGLYVLSPFVTDYREYIETPLSQPLIAGETYWVEAHVQVSDKYCGAAIDELGFYLSPVSFAQAPTIGVLDVTPQVTSATGQFLEDQQGWTSVGGSFVASGGEAYLVIGNFKDDASTSTQSISPACDATIGTYLYVDCVSVRDTACTTAPDGLVGWWPLDETVLSTSRDLIAGNDALAYVENAAPVPQPGMVAYGLLCLGDGNGFVAADDAPELNFGFNEDFSIDAWVRLTAPPLGAGTQVLVQKHWTPVFDYGYGLLLEDDLLHLALISSTGTVSLLSTDAVPNDTDWHFLCVTVDRDDPAGVRFYVDGVQLGAALDPTVAVGDLTTSAPLAIGGDPSPWEELPTLDGTIDEVELFARALAPAEVLALSAAGPNGKCKDDCNANGILDREDIAAGASLDLDDDGIPDECQGHRRRAYPVSKPLPGRQL